MGLEVVRLGRNKNSVEKSIEMLGFQYSPTNS
jgi:hypothetical protein